jgi:hypothetical protein
MYISTLVTMADVQRDYFLEEAEKHYPGIADKYRQRYKHYYRCRSYSSRKLWDIFVETCEQEGMCYNMKAANHMLRSGYDLSVLNPLQL